VTPAPGPDESPVATTSVEVSARFVASRGLDEEFVRARAELAWLPSDVLQLGECSSAAQLGADRVAAEGEPAEARELVLMDAGELHVLVGGRRLVVPPRVVPDLLPYMSGVTYDAEDPGSADVTLAAGDAVVVEARGALGVELADFRVTAELPETLEVALVWDPRGDDVASLAWSASDAEADVIAQLAPLRAGEPAGDAVVCRLPDAGTAVLDGATLRLHGLDPAAVEGVRLTLSRQRRRVFDSGEFAGVDLVVESREVVDGLVPR
jgi:hypothetical protein